MATFNASQTFLHDAAGKHLVIMEYEAVEPGGEVYCTFATCFVIEIDGRWLLITAGHVINNIVREKAARFTHRRFTLNDRAAGGPPDGKDYWPIPFEFEPGRWIVVEIDAEGLDYAALPLRPLYVEGLKAGGVTPLGEHTWGDAPPESYPKWLLVGVPAQHYAKGRGGATRMMLSILPLEPAKAPAGAIGKERRTFARIVDDPPGHDGAGVTDVAGMSGGPIYGVLPGDGVLTYWVIGIQSSWFDWLRVVSFCHAGEFFEAVKAALAGEVKGAV